MECEVNAFELSIRPAARWFKHRIDFIASLDQIDAVSKVLGLAPEDEAGRITAHGLQLSITDFVAEIHDTHHPIGVSLYYEDQKDEALKRAAEFRENRIPKFFNWFETILARNPVPPERWWTFEGVA